MQKIKVSRQVSAFPADEMFLGLAVGSTVLLVEISAIALIALMGD
jgi:hypothetical protein